MIYVGKRFDFVWGEGSRNYSEMVIRSYVCRHAVNIGNPDNLHLYTLAAIHKTGANIKNQIANQFKNMVRMANTESKCKAEDCFATTCLTKCYYVLINFCMLIVCIFMKISKIVCE